MENISDPELKIPAMKLWKEKKLKNSGNDFDIAKMFKEREPKEATLHVFKLR